MFFESRWQVPDVSPGWRPIREAFLVDSPELPELGARVGDWQAPEDALLAADVVRTGGNERRYRAIVRHAQQRWPDDPRLRALRAHATATAGWPLRALELLEGEPGATEPEDALVVAARARILAYSGRLDPSRREAAAVPDSARSDPRVLYLLATAAAARRDWDDAIALGAAACAAAPRWTRARMLHADALLSRARVAEARALIDEGIAAQPARLELRLVAAMHAFARGEPAEAATHLAHLPADGPIARDASGLRAFVLWALGDAAGAGLAAASFLPVLQARIASASGTSSRRALLPTLTMSQDRDACVPTAATMAAAAHGVTLDVRALAEEMRTRRGTRTWRMLEVLRAHGFEVTSVRPEPEVMKALLERGVPLVGEIRDLSGGHVEVVCGFDDALGLWCIRDPIAWMPRFLEQPSAATRYRSPGAGLWAVALAERAPIVPGAWRAPELEALAQLHRAVDLGDVTDAEHAAALISDTSPHAVVRDLVGREVVLTPNAAARRFRALAADEAAPIEARKVAFLELDEVEQAQVGDALLNAVESAVGPERCLLRALVRRAQGRRTEALADIDALVRRRPQVAALWTLRALLLTDLGRLDEARAAVAWVRDVEPLAPPRDLERRLAMGYPTFAEDRAEIEAALAADPDNAELRACRALLLEQSPDGLERERATREQLRRAPRSPRTWEALARWFAVQDREDLAESVRAEAHLALGSADPLARDDHATSDDSALTEGAAAEAAGSHAPFAGAQDLMAPGPGIDGPPWWQNALALAARIRAELRQGGVAGPAGAVAAVLPATLLGPLVEGLEVCLEALPIEGLDRLTAETLLRWADRLLAHDGGLPTGRLRLHLAALASVASWHARAATLMEAAVEAAPEDAHLLAQAAMMALRQVRLEKAHAWLERARERAPGDERVLRLFVALAVETRDANQRATGWEALARLRPYDPGFLEVWADATSDARGGDVALALLEEAAPRFPAGVIAVVAARIHVGEGRCDAALQCLRDVGPDAHDWVAKRALFTRGACASSMADRDAERSVLDEALSRWPDDADFVVAKARWLRHANSLVDAEALLRGAFERGIVDASLARQFVETVPGPEHMVDALESVSAERRRWLAEALVDACAACGEWDHRLELLRWCERHLPEAPNLAHALAEALLERKDDAAAEAIADRLLAEDAGCPARLELAAACREARAPQEALRLYEASRQRTGETPGLQWRLARTWERLGRLDEARSLWTGLLADTDLGPGAWEALYRLRCPAESLWPSGRALLPRASLDGLARFESVALDLERALPIEWLEAALDRLMTEHRGSDWAREDVANSVSHWLRAWEYEELAPLFAEIPGRTSGSAAIPPADPVGRAAVQAWCLRVAGPGGPLSLHASEVAIEPGALVVQGERLPLGGIEDVQVRRRPPVERVRAIGLQAFLCYLVFAMGGTWRVIGAVLLVGVAFGVARDLRTQLHVCVAGRFRRWWIEEEPAAARHFAAAMRAVIAARPLGPVAVQAPDPPSAIQNQ